MRSTSIVGASSMILAAWAWAVWGVMETVTIPQSILVGAALVSFAICLSHTEK